MNSWIYKLSNTLNKIQENESKIKDLESNIKIIIKDIIKNKSEHILFKDCFSRDTAKLNKRS